MQKLQTYILLLSGLILCGCDKTTLEGSISPAPIEVTVGDTATIYLEVPDNLDGIHQENYVVTPDSLATISFEESSAEKASYRQVDVIGLKAGVGIIEVWGFYKQTNPQFITEEKLIVSSTNSIKF